MNADKQTQIAILDDIIVRPEHYLPAGLMPTQENLLTIKNAAFEAKLNLEGDYLTDTKTGEKVYMSDIASMRVL